ncbi:MAG: hypothetical protein WC602_03295 [archaeon]
MLRVCLIGPGDMQYHYGALLGIPEGEFSAEIEGIAKSLADAGVEIVLLPDAGAAFEVAKEYKRSGGTKAIGTLPVSDSDFGIKHLQKFVEEQAEGKKVIDETIDTGNWYKQDICHCLFGDVVLVLGNSLGSMGELAYGYYFYNLFALAKDGMESAKQKIGAEIKAGTRIKFTTIIYEPFVKELMNIEMERYIIKCGGEVLYVKTPEELLELLKGLEPEAQEKGKTETQGESQ